MFNNKNVLRIVSLIIAVCLWVYVMGEVNPETKVKIGDIKVSFINTEVLYDAGLAVAESEELNVSAVVKGKRSDVNDLKKTGLTAYADVEKCEEGQNTVNIIVNVPDGIRLESVSQSTADIVVEEVVSASKQVEIDFVNEGDDKEIIPWALEYTPEEIIVSGAASSVKAIDHIRGTVDAADVTEDVTNVEAVLAAVDKDGDVIPGIILSYNVAYADVQILSSKLVSVDLETVNLEPGVEIDDLEVYNSVRVVGTSETLEQMDRVKAELDMAGITKTQKTEMNINLPEDVYLYSEEADSVKVILKNDK